MSDRLPTSPRLTFRRMTPADLDDMAALLGSSEVMAYYPRPKTRDEAAAWIAWNEENYARDGLGLWILHDSSGAFVGDCGLMWQVVDGVEDLEVGYHVLPRFQGLGLATEAALACREFARSRGIERLIAIIHPDNRPSQRVAEKMGLSAEKDTANAAGVPTRVYSARL
ncbi:MAG TPA: GNAT family N-acetyltransferase [Jatrophihabitantaceae bacterium]